MLNAKTRVDWKEASQRPDPCLICGGLAKVPLYQPTYFEPIENAPSYFLAHRSLTAHGPIVRCRDCGFVYTSPRFADSIYDRIYKAVRPPENLDPSFRAATDARFRRLAEIVRKFQPREASFLDFGCGDGAFLHLFDSAQGRGFEVGPEGRRTAGRCEIVTGDWGKVANSRVMPSAAFDFVVAFDVLEHLPRINEDLALIRSVLKPGGLFFASVPNIESVAARVMGKHWNMLLLEHLWYFSPKTLDRFMAGHGFCRLSVQSVPFDAPIAHIATRIAQAHGMAGAFRVGPVSRLVLPVPAGVMLGVFRRTD
jgi:SAM-dependent methyltransferase